MNKKLYAIKNDEGDWADTRYIFGYGTWVTPDKTSREEYVKRHGGHVVTLIEEPKKVVLTKEQAEVVDEAHIKRLPATYISGKADTYSGEESLLMSAYVNGYTVEKEKKYNVKVPHTDDVWYYKSVDGILRAIGLIGKEFRGKFTEAEIEHYGLQDCERLEINTEE